MEGKYDPRNKLNDLTGKEWLKLTKSFWMSEKCADDKAAFQGDTLLIRGKHRQEDAIPFGSFFI